MGECFQDLITRIVDFLRLIIENVQVLWKPLSICPMLGQNLAFNIQLVRYGNCKQALAPSHSTPACAFVSYVLTLQCEIWHRNRYGRSAERKGERTPASIVNKRSFRPLIDRDLCFSGWRSWLIHDSYGSWHLYILFFIDFSCSFSLCCSRYLKRTQNKIIRLSSCPN